MIFRRSPDSPVGLREFCKDSTDKAMDCFFLVLTNVVGHAICRCAFPDKLISRRVDHVDREGPLRGLLDGRRRHRATPHPVAPAPVHADTGAGIARADLFLRFQHEIDQHVGIVVLVSPAAFFKFVCRRSYHLRAQQ